MPETEPLALTLPIRRLVEFLLRSGSIDSRFTGFDRANEGATRSRPPPCRRSSSPASRVPSTGPRRSAMRPYTPCKTICLPCGCG